ncbi:hypothetical protein [Actinacidiphila yeochonensis]|uniref:hypothetical protein n=1 Tax=Actinacidiphila yeochonensis TaxID=89050 RepID=UPI00055A2CFE|nr:hypothetical protein [Actinacidiphila yeochonensis]
MEPGEVWWVELDERRPVVLLRDDGPSGFRAMWVTDPADPAGPVGFGLGLGLGGRDLDVEVALGAEAGLPFEGVLRFASPRPGFTPCTWLTTLDREDLAERAGALPPAKLDEVEDALHSADRPREWDAAVATTLSAMRDALRRDGSR